MIFHQPHNSQGNYNYNSRIYVDTAFAPHFHKNLEFIYTVHGVTRVNIGHRQLSLSKGQATLVLSNQIHSLSVPADSKSVVVVFSEEYVPKFASTVKGFEAQEPVFEINKAVIDLFTENIVNKKSSILMRKACFYAICDEFYSSTEFSERKDSKESSVVNILDWISRNYSSNISLSDVAREFGYEYHYLSRLLNQTYNISFSRLVNGYRVEKATELLQDTDLPITEIVYRSGFQSIRNFNHAIRSATGKSPKEFRKK